MRNIFDLLAEARKAGAEKADEADRQLTRELLVERVRSALEKLEDARE